MKAAYEQALEEIWRQVMLNDAKIIQLGADHFPVRRTGKRKLRQVDFIFDGQQFRGIEQNPDTTSRWAEMARAGKKVMQFLSGGRYVAVVVDGTAQIYGDSEQKPD